MNFFNIFLCKLNFLKINFIFIFLSLILFIYLNNKLIFYLYIYLNFIFSTEKNNFILNTFYLGYYKIHPVLLYLSLIIYLLYTVVVKKIFKYSLVFTLKLIVLTFFLGSLWALNQSIWGKYWSNDSIELILVLFIVYILYKNHKLFNNFSNYVYFFSSSFFLLIIYLRLNLIYTKHNFFDKISSLRNY